MASLFAWLVATVVIPLQVVGGYGNEPRLGITVVLGTQQVQVMVDTGSPGLRILRKVVHPDVVHPTGKQTGIGYGSGLQVNGEEALTNFAVGPATVSNSPIELVDTYAWASPPPRDLPPEEFGGVFPGILGIGQRYIVHSGLRDPRIILDPDDSLVNSFTLVDIDNGGHVQGCIRVDGLINYDFCGRVLFDTGSPFLMISGPLDPPFGPAPPGTIAHLRIAGWSQDFVASPFSRIVIRRSANSIINIGLAPLQNIDLLFDAEHRQIGVRSAT